MSQEKEHLNYDPNKYEHDYIVGILENFMADCIVGRPKPTTIDHYACQLTAFMHGEIARELKDKLKK